MDADQFQDLLDRLRRGDDAARQELIACAYERLQQLARNLLHQDFPRLDRLHETASVANETAVRLLQALRTIRPTTAGEFFSLAIQHMRWALLNLAARQDRRAGEVNWPNQGEGSTQDSFLDRQPAARAEEPPALALWTEFHRRVEQLPPEERAVVDLCWYFGRSQSEAARILEIHPKEVSRRWIKARLQLAA
jgi:RNA polymerase sigma factor (sigma-70 family)